MPRLSFSLTKPISRRQNKKNGKHNGMGEVPMFLSSSPRHSYQSSSGRYWKVLDELGAVFSFGSEMLGSLWRSWLALRQRYSCSYHTPLLEVKQVRQCELAFSRTMLGVIATRPTPSPKSSPKKEQGHYWASRQPWCERCVRTHYMIETLVCVYVKFA